MARHPERKFRAVGRSPDAKAVSYHRHHIWRIDQSSSREGFSLLEVLIAMALLTLILLSFFGMVWQFQMGNTDLLGRLERDEQMRLSPLLLTRYLCGAGSRQWIGDWPGLEIEGHQLVARSDSTGSDGFPDGELSGRFEKLALRQQRRDLGLRSGRGSFQPIVSHIHQFRAGWTGGSLLVLHLGAMTRQALQHGEPEEVQIELKIPLYAYRPNLFREAEP